MVLAPFRREREADLRGRLARSSRAGLSARRTVSANTAAMVNGASGRPTAPAATRETSGSKYAKAISAFLKRQKAGATPLAEEPDERDGQERQIIVEQERAHKQAGADDRRGLRRRPKGAALQPKERRDDCRARSRSALPRRAQANHA